MVLDKEQNKERMKKERAQKERAQKEEEKKEIIAGVVAAVCDVLPNMIAEHHLYQGVVPTKVSCREEAAHPVPHTPPGAMRTGGTRGRSPAVDSGNGRTKATKQEAPTPPTPPKPLTPAVFTPAHSARAPLAALTALLPLGPRAVHREEARVGARRPGRRRAQDLPVSDGGGGLHDGEEALLQVERATCAAACVHVRVLMRVVSGRSSGCFNPFGHCPFHVRVRLYPRRARARAYMRVCVQPRQGGSSPFGSSLFMCA